MKLSRHFREKWKERFGAEPDLDQVTEIIRNSVWVLKCRDMRYANSGSPFRTLATYVNFEREIIIKVDEISGVVVTVMTEGDEEYTSDMERAYGPRKGKRVYLRRNSLIQVRSAKA